MKIAFAIEPGSLAPKFALGSGLNEFNWIFNSFLTYSDVAGKVHPMLATEIPSQENGTWVINPDGTMVTTYRIRADARWHDGTPVTAGDFAFAYRVYMDPEIPVRERTPETLMSGVEAPDDHTLVVTWSGLYSDANVLGYQQLDPLPRHLLEEKYRSNRASFLFGEEWTAAYVGAGPYRVERWEPGSVLIAKANADWFFATPKTEILEIHFIPDPTTIVANLLSGEVDMTSSPAVRLAEASAVRDTWVARGDGYLKNWDANLRYMEFQFREVPNWQRAVTDLRVRQALMHAIDRDALVEALSFGIGSPADAFIARTDAVFPNVDRAITKYPFDPQRAIGRLSEAGWTAPSPGARATNAAGQTLDMNVWSGDQAELAVIADGWKAVGINPSTFAIPAQLNQDQQTRVSFPATATTGRAIALRLFVFTTDRIPLAETRYIGPNRGSFSDPEVDRLYDLLMRSIDTGERGRTQVALHKRLSEVLGIGPLNYNVEVILAKTRVKGPVGRNPAQPGVTWNAYEWEVAE